MAPRPVLLQSHTGRTCSLFSISGYCVENLAMAYQNLNNLINLIILLIHFFLPQMLRDFYRIIK